MRFLLDANLPRSAAGAVQRLGHDAVDVRDVGLGGADDARIAATVVKVLVSFLSQPELLAHVPGRLAIVESWRVRIRPAC